MGSTPFQVTALVVAAIAVAYDLRRKRVPNWVTLWILPVAPVLWALRFLSAKAVFEIPAPLFYGALSLTGAVACAAVPLLLFRFSLIGGADVKLLACLGALLMPHTGILAELVAFVLAALLLPMRLAYHGRLFSTLLGSASSLVGSLRSRHRDSTLPAAMTDRVPFTPFVLAGALVALLVPRVGA
jgi:Flp pilus assembly protein protease CpaA